jgi:hypothetical protein
LLSVVAEVRNPRTTPVRVPLRASDGGYLEKFGVQLRSLSTGEVLVGRSEIAATDALAVSSRGVRRALLDFDLTSLAGEIGPENLEVIVTFGRAAAAVDTVEVSP